MSLIPVLVSAGVGSGDISAGITDDASSVTTVATGSSEAGTNSADSTSVSGIVELLAELELASVTAADSGFGTVST